MPLISHGALARMQDLDPAGEQRSCWQRLTGETPKDSVDNVLVEWQLALEPLRCGNHPT